MKRIIMTMAAVLMISAAAFAHGDNQKKDPPTQEEMAQQMTQRMAARYGLDDSQKSALLTLNKQWANKMPRHHGGRPGGQRLRRPGVQPGDSSLSMSRPSHEQMEKHMKQMKANQEAYSAELKKIMTDEQFAKYTADQQQRQERWGRRGGRQRN